MLPPDPSKPWIDRAPKRSTRNQIVEEVISLGKQYSKARGLLDMVYSPATSKAVSDTGGVGAVVSAFSKVTAALPSREDLSHHMCIILTIRCVSQAC